MNRGRIEQHGTPDEIYMQPRSAFVAAFIGRTNWFHGRISGAPSAGYFRLTTDAGTTLAIRDPGAGGGEKRSICIRPERIAVTGAEAAGKSGDNVLPGQVVDVVNMMRTARPGW